MTIARFGSEPQKARWLREGGEGELMLTPALSEDFFQNPVKPITRAENDGSQWMLTGSKTVVPVGPLADLFVVPASTSDGVTVFLVHADDPGVVITNQELSGGELGARVDLDRAAMPLDRVLGVVGDGEDIVRWLGEHLTVALCAQQLGTLEGALRLTSEYAKTREQFGRPIGTFQAVSQRLADGYIDVLGARLTLWQAAWQLSQGLPGDRGGRDREALGRRRRPPARAHHGARARRRRHRPRRRGPPLLHRGQAAGVPARRGDRPGQADRRDPRAPLDMSRTAA